MTLLISAFGIAGRFAGDLLTSALGWASSLLFGRVPRSHQIYVVLMMAGSFLWVLVVLGLLIPTVASFYLDATPHPPFIDHALVGFVLVVSAVVLPLLVGIAGYLVPSDGRRPTGLAILKEPLRGYLLAPLLAGLLVFLAVVGTVRKARSRQHGWQDVHVAIVVEPGHEDDLAADLEDALDEAGIKVVSRDAPRVLTAPAWLLTRVAGPNVAKLRPERLVELAGRDLRVGVYPSDIAISGRDGPRIRARAAILTRLVTCRAHQVTSAEGQRLEDRLRKLAASDRRSSRLSAARSCAAFASIDAELLQLEIPSDEWDVLLRLRLQVERDLLLGRDVGTVPLGPDPTPSAKDRSATRRAAGVRARPAAARSATARP